MESERIITISADHPSLAGHFPGHPVVPGVVMLGRVVKAIRGMARDDGKFSAMPAAKFLSPLTPGEPLTIRIDQQGDGTMEFTCATGPRLIASGCLQYRIIADNSPGDS